MDVTQLKLFYPSDEAAQVHEQPLRIAPPNPLPVTMEHHRHRVPSLAGREPPHSAKTLSDEASSQATVALLRPPWTVPSSILRLEVTDKGVRKEVLRHSPCPCGAPPDSNSANGESKCWSCVKGAWKTKLQMKRNIGNGDDEHDARRNGDGTVVEGTEEGTKDGKGAGVRRESGKQGNGGQGRSTDTVKNRPHLLEPVEPIALRSPTSPSRFGHVRTPPRRHGQESIREPPPTPNNSTSLLSWNDSDLSDLTDLEDLEREMEAPKTPAPKTSMPSATGLKIRIRLPPKSVTVPGPSTPSPASSSTFKANSVGLSTRFCAIKQCSRPLLPGYKWKCCSECRARTRQYQRKRLGFEGREQRERLDKNAEGQRDERKVKLGIKARDQRHNNGEGRELLDPELQALERKRAQLAGYCVAAVSIRSGSPNLVSPLNKSKLTEDELEMLGSDLLKTRVCTIHNCYRPLPARDEYKWKMCVPCRRRTTDARRARALVASELHDSGGKVGL